MQYRCKCCGSMLKKYEDVSKGIPAITDSFMCQECDYIVTQDEIDENIGESEFDIEIVE